MKATSALTTLLLALPLAACGGDDEMGDSVGDDLQEAGQDVQDAAEEAADEVEDAADEATDGSY